MLYLITTTVLLVRQTLPLVQFSPPRQTAYQFFAIVNALQILLRAALSFVLPLQPRLDALVLVVEVVHVGHQVLDDVHMRQGVDLGRFVTARVDLTVNKIQLALHSVADQFLHDLALLCNVFVTTYVPTITTKLCLLLCEYFFSLIINNKN